MTMIGLTRSLAPSMEYYKRSEIFEQRSAELNYRCIELRTTVYDKISSEGASQTTFSYDVTFYGWKIQKCSNATTKFASIVGRWGYWHPWGIKNVCYSSTRYYLFIVQNPRQGCYHHWNIQCSGWFSGWPSKQRVRRPITTNRTRYLKLVIPKHNPGTRKSKTRQPCDPCQKQYVSPYWDVRQHNRLQTKIPLANGPK